MSNVKQSPLKLAARLPTPPPPAGCCLSPQSSSSCCYPPAEEEDIEWDEALTQDDVPPPPPPPSEDDLEPPPPPDDDEEIPPPLPPRPAAKWNSPISERRRRQSVSAKAAAGALPPSLNRLRQPSIPPPPLPPPDWPSTQHQQQMSRLRQCSIPPPPLPPPGGFGSAGKPIPGAPAMEQQQPPSVLTICGLSQNGNLLNSFVEFLSRDGGSPNAALFLVDMLEWSNSGVKRRTRAEALRLYNKFLADGAPFLVPMTSNESLRAKLWSTLQACPASPPSAPVVPPAAFDLVAWTLIKDLEAGPLPQWQQSGEWRAMQFQPWESPEQPRSVLTAFKNSRLEGQFEMYLEEMNATPVYELLKALDYFLEARQATPELCKQLLDLAKGSLALLMPELSRALAEKVIANTWSNDAQFILVSYRKILALLERDYFPQWVQRKTWTLVEKQQQH